jgi:uncharacterized protein YdaT
MPWYNGAFPPSYKYQPVDLRNKATEIANELLLHGADEGVAIATGLKRARQYFAAKERRLTKTKTTGTRTKLNHHEPGQQG